MKVLNHRILLRKEPEGGSTVIVPSLPGCVTYGDTIEEAIKMAKEAIELYIESLKEHGETDEKFGCNREGACPIEISLNDSMCIDYKR